LAWQTGAACSIRHAHFATWMRVPEKRPREIPHSVLLRSE
jgi:hypothetical protein